MTLRARPESMGLLSTFGIAETSLPEAFATEDAEYICASAQASMVKPMSLPKLDTIARIFTTQAATAEPLRKTLKRWEDARAAAQHLMGAIPQLTDDGGLAALLEEFCQKADKLKRFEAGVRRFPRKRERSSAGPPLMLTIMLSLEYERLFGRKPTASPGGSFDGFCEAFLECLRKKMTGRPEIKIPAAGTILKILQAVPKASS